MNRLLIMAVSGLVSIGSIALAGPKLGFFVWTSDLESERAGAPERPAAETTQGLSPVTDSSRQTEKPAWIDQSIAALESDVARFKEELEKVEEEAARNRAALEKAREESAELRKKPKETPRQEWRPPRRTASPPPGPRLSVTDCRISSALDNKLTFEFTVHNSSQRTVDAVASVYLIEQDYMLGPQRSLVNEIRIEVPSGQRKFSPTWLVIDPMLGGAECEVELRD